MQPATGTSYEATPAREPHLVAPLLDSPARFCVDLAALLDRRTVSLRAAEKSSGWGKSTIAAARRGPDLPNVELVVDVLQGIGEPEMVREQWRARHARLSESHRGVDPTTIRPTLRVVAEMAAAGSITDASSDQSTSRGAESRVPLPARVSKAAAPTARAPRGASPRSSGQQLPSLPQPDRSSAAYLEACRALAQALRDVRERAGLSLSEMAHRIDVPLRTLAQAERPDGPPATWATMERYRNAAAEPDDTDALRQLRARVQTALHAGSADEQARQAADSTDGSGNPAVIAVDLTGVVDLATFVNALDVLHRRAGSPSFAILARRLGNRIPPTTFWDLFKPNRRRLKWSVVEGFLTACEVPEWEIHRWAHAFATITPTHGETARRAQDEFPPAVEPSSLEPAPQPHRRRRPWRRRSIRRQAQD